MRLSSCNGPMYRIHHRERFSERLTSRGARKTAKLLEIQPRSGAHGAPVRPRAPDGAVPNSTLSQSSTHPHDFIEVLRGSIPPRSRGGPIEAKSSCCARGSTSSIPPRSRGGPIEASPGRGRPRLEFSPFHRVHAVAPLKLVLEELLQLGELPFHRVHAVAPLKRADADDVVEARHAIPPRSRGGPIEASRSSERDALSDDIPPRSRGGPIEAVLLEQLGGTVADIPPRSRGGPIEARSPKPRQGSWTHAFHRVHAVAPLKQRRSHLCSPRNRPFHRVHAVAPLKRSSRET